MQLWEKVRDFLKPPKDDLSLEVPVDKVKKDFTRDEYQIDYFSFFDTNNSGVFYDDVYRVSAQAQKIDIYRQTSRIDSVAVALGILTDEIIYTEEFKEPLVLHCDVDNTKIEGAIKESFENIMNLFNISKNIYQLVLSTYVDGQMNVFLDYGKGGGVSKIILLDPRFLTFNLKENKYKYLDVQGANTLFHSRAIDPAKIREYQIEQIASANFGLISDDGLVLSEIEKIVKTANQLKTLEDLLIPLRFSRSISRRVFNVDVSDLPNSKAEAYMRNIANKFKYRKEYNTQTGEIKNQQHMTSMVEDYWISSRGGQKGITVDLLDEQGNLGQLEDIKLFQRKLYQGIGIPENRITDENGQTNSVFDLAADQITNDDIQFFMKVRRIRTVYTDFFKNIMKRDLVSKKVLTEAQFNDLKDQIDIKFSSENQFMERMRITLFMRKLDAWGSAREYAGKLFGVRYLYKLIFGLDEKETDEILKELEKESKDPLLKGFYQQPSEDGVDFE